MVADVDETVRYQLEIETPVGVWKSAAGFGSRRTQEEAETDYGRYHEYWNNQSEKVKREHGYDARNWTRVVRVVTRTTREPVYPPG